MNKAALNTYVQVLYGLMFMFSFLLGKYLEMGLLGHILSVCLTLYEILKLFSKVSVPFCFHKRVSIPAASHPLYTWYDQSFKIPAIVIGVQWYLIVVEFVFS